MAETVSAASSWALALARCLGWLAWRYYILRRNLARELFLDSIRRRSRRFRNASFPCGIVQTAQIVVVAKLLDHPFKNPPREW